MSENRNNSNNNRSNCFTNRESNRELICGASHPDAYIEIFVDTALDLCEERDCKGLYKLARKGIIKQFTGISDPFEIPENAELTLGGELPLEINIEKIINFLTEKGLY